MGKKHLKLVKIILGVVIRLRHENEIYLRRPVGLIVGSSKSDWALRTGFPRSSHVRRPTAVTAAMADY